MKTAGASGLSADFTIVAEGYLRNLSGAHTANMVIVMVNKLSCPVCTCDSLQPILRDVHFSACVGSITHELTDFLAYSCTEGHVFLVMSVQKDVVESERGFSLIV